MTPRRTAPPSVSRNAARNFGFPTAACGCLLLILLGTAPHRATAPADPAREAAAPEESSGLSAPSSRLFQRVFGMILSDYVEPREPGQIIKGALDGLAASTGPESAYIPPAQAAAYRAFQEGGPRASLPLYITKGGDFARIIIPFPDQDPKIRPSDALRSIDGSSTFDMTYPECLIAMSGKEGEEVSCVFLKQDEWKTYAVTLKRCGLPAPEWVSRPEGGVLVLASLPSRLSRTVLEGLASSSAVLIDLRGCAQESVDAALSTAGLLLGDGRALARGQHGEVVRPFRGTSLLEGRAVRVLVGATTARGGEILAAALKESGALLVGEQTLGWAPLQEEFPLKDGGVLRINTAYFLGPDGEPMNDHPIQPDLPLVPGEDEGRDALYDRALTASPEKEPPK